MEWINVKDSMPPESMSLLIYGRWVDEEKNRVMEARYYKPGRYFIAHERFAPFITHWMPMPDLPKEAE